MNLWDSFEGNFRLDHQRVDEQFTTPANTYKLDGYHLTNFRFTLTDSAEPRWTLSLYANNLTNEAVPMDVSKYGPAFGLLDPLSYVFAQPRHVGLEFTWRAQ